MAKSLCDLYRSWAILGLITCMLAWSSVSVVVADCIWDCAQNMLCQGTTISCPGCDLGIGDACSDWTETTYPNTVIKRVEGGDRRADLQAEVVCFKLTTCGNTGSNWFEVCAFGSCQLSPAVLQWCTTCGPVGAVSNNNANHYTCSSCGS